MRRSYRLLHFMGFILHKTGYKVFVIVNKHQKKAYIQVSWRRPYGYTCIYVFFVSFVSSLLTRSCFVFVFVRLAFRYAPAEPNKNKSTAAYCLPRPLGRRVPAVLSWFLHSATLHKQKTPPKPCCVQLLLSALPLRSIAPHQQHPPRRGKRARKKPLSKEKNNQQKILVLLFSCLRTAALCSRKFSPRLPFRQGYTSAPDVAALSPCSTAAKKLLMHWGAAALIVHS